jgi:hypothetical protein
MLRRSTTLALLALTLATMAGCGDGDSSDSERDVARTFAEWRVINPALEAYVPLHEDFVPEMGIHWGVQGPHVTVGVGHDDVVTVVEIIVPEATGWYPWFDQPEGEPMEIEGLGMVYTQHVWTTERSSVVPDQRPETLPLTLDALTAANPALEQYEPISPYVPGMGIHFGVPGPAVVIAASEDGEVNAFEIISPAAAGWYPWFDQPEGEPMEIEGVGDVYTQHLYVVDRASVE